MALFGSSIGTGLGKSLLPGYLRVAITDRCPLACSFCHGEGQDLVRPGEGGRARSRSTVPTVDEWVALIGAAVDLGVRKVKFVGGEPLIYKDLPAVVSALRQRSESLDLSVITSGAVRWPRLEACFAAGLDRANMSIHGFSQIAFEQRTKSRNTWEIRQDTLARLLGVGRPVKLNYVYTGIQDEPDLAALLAWAADKAVCVGVLDDLSMDNATALDMSALGIGKGHRSVEVAGESWGAGPAAVLAALHRIVGEPVETWEEPDPVSLSTRRLRFASGVLVEVKNRHLGQTAPWMACGGCPKKAQCREGIDALRLMGTGSAQPCMDRPDLAVPLVDLLRNGSISELQTALVRTGGGRC